MHRSAPRQYHCLSCLPSTAGRCPTALRTTQFESSIRGVSLKRASRYVSSSPKKKGRATRPSGVAWVFSAAGSLQT